MNIYHAQCAQLPTSPVLVCWCQTHTAHDAACATADQQQTTVKRRFAIHFRISKKNFATSPRTQTSLSAITANSLSSHLTTMHSTTQNSFAQCTKAHVVYIQPNLQDDNTQRHLQAAPKIVGMRPPCSALHGCPCPSSHPVSTTPPPDLPE